MLATPMRALLLLALVRLGETERAEQVLAASASTTATAGR